MKFPDVKFMPTDATRTALERARVGINVGTEQFVCRALPVNPPFPPRVREASLLIQSAIMAELNGQAHRSLMLWLILHHDALTFVHLTPEYMREYRLAWIDHMLQNRY